MAAVLAQECLDLDSSPGGFAAGKVVALLSASPGLLGGVRSRLSLQIVLGKLGARHF
jgi:NAD(P)H-dependent FMN reductase